MKKTLIFATLALVSLSMAAQNLADLFEVNKQSVVTIYVAEVLSAGTGDPRTFTSNMGLGSGILVKNDVILTAAHVVATAEEIMVQFFDGETIPATIFRTAKEADVALIRLEKPPKNPRLAVLGNSDKTRIGDDIFVVGAPLGLPYSLSRGVISGRHSEDNVYANGKILEFFQTDASINTGNSGGPIFNFQGEVIGIVSSILSRSGGFEGIGFAATSNVAASILRERGSRFFGIEATLLSYEMAKILNVPQESGWLVQHVVQNSPAGQIGVKGGYLRVTMGEDELLLGGDVILQVDDIKIKDPESLMKLLAYLNNVNSTVTHVIKVLRAGQIVELRWISRDFEPSVR